MMILAVLVAAALVLGVILGFAGERRPVVTSQALPCAEMGGRLVCFDGGPVGDLRCEPSEDGSVVLCTRS